MGDLVDLDEYRRRRKNKIVTPKEEFSRDDHNATVVEKLKNGDNLSTCKKEDTWFPQRGVFDREKGRMVPLRPKTDDTEQ